MRSAGAKLVVGSLRELTTIGLVCGLGSAYATALVIAGDILSTIGDKDGGSVGAQLAAVAAVFIGVALFVSGVVISNGVDTVIAARHQQLTMLRLVGADSHQLRDSLLRAVVAVAAIGATIGLVLSVITGAVVRKILVRRGTLPDTDYHVVPIAVWIAAAAVMVTAVVAAVAGARRPLAGTAVVATSRSGEVSVVRTASSVVLICLGMVGLAGAAILGEKASAAGILVAFGGASTVCAGILLSARMVVPRLVAVAGRLLGGSAPSLVARKNAVSDPLRTTRSTIGLLIGVTLVTTISAGMNSLTEATDSWRGMSPEQADIVRQTMSVVSAVLIGMVAISAIIAAVGFVSTMSLTVITRTREIGMLRAMGFTARQVRSMITLESLALSGTAALAGLALGIVFGSVGAQSVVGRVTSGIPVGLPWQALSAIVGGTLVLVLVASLPPSRRAVGISPVDALATS
ncbi:ABC transporter permease [Williamsia sterculiae]|uniref:Putative ABC transport system permease protein n=1 Tax=Williamsia sterculiae TaxID=1344003 RepID=A0A1N7GWH6_9NOCA|nr:FtsX-like permease family protein [Williamsia sterculiae]SIS16924.1 putative ABC transport system permease protein [Williamsia sterculiae]